MSTKLSIDLNEDGPLIGHLGKLNLQSHGS